MKKSFTRLKAAAFSIAFVALCSNLAQAVVLFDQTDSPAGASFRSNDQNFEAEFDSFDSMVADDFVVTGGGWNIDQLFVDGSRSDTGLAGGVTGVTVTFYANNGALPGAVLFTLTGNTVNDVGGDLTVDLSQNVMLSAGTYWVGWQVSQDFTPFGLRFSDHRSIQSGSQGVWANPGDGFATGCITFTQNTSCGFANPDYLFRLSGTVKAADVPEPAILTLLGAGLVGLGFAGRRRETA